MPRNRKFDFFPIQQKGRKSDYTNATLSIYKSGQLLISKAANHKYGLDGKSVEFIWDAKKKALGMRETMRVYGSPSWNKRTMRILKTNPKVPGIIYTSVGRLMKDIEMNGKNFKDLEVGEYTSLIDGHHKTWYVVLKDKKEEDEDDTLD